MRLRFHTRCYLQLLSEPLHISISPLLPQLIPLSFNSVIAEQASARVSHGSAECRELSRERRRTACEGFHWLFVLELRFSETFPLRRSLWDVPSETFPLRRSLWDVTEQTGKINAAHVSVSPRTPCWRIKLKCERGEVMGGGGGGGEMCCSQFLHNRPV